MLQELVFRLGQRLAPRLEQGQRAQQLIPVTYGHCSGRGLEVGQLRPIGERERIRGRGPVGPDRHRPQLGPDPDPGLGPDGPGGAGQDGHHLRDGFVVVQLAGHIVGNVGQHLVGRGPVAVHQAVGDPAGPLPGGLEEQGDRDGRGDRQPRAVLPPGERSDAQHDPGVHSGQPGRDQAVDDRAVNDDVDLVQPVLQDPKRDRGREPEQPDDGGRGKGSPRDGWHLTVVGQDACDRYQLDQGEGGHGQRHPVDLAPQLPAACPVAQHQRQCSRPEERQGQQGQGIEVVNVGPGKRAPDGRNGERILVRECVSAGCRQGHRPGNQDVADQQQPGGQEIQHQDRTPAPRPQGPGREEEKAFRLARPRPGKRATRRRRRPAGARAPRRDA